MTNFKLEWRFSASLTKEEIVEILENVSADMGFKVRKQALTEVQARGRKSPATRKINYWLEHRTKPFTAKVFADFVGLSPAAAWRRLDRLVAQGKVYKHRNEDGTVEYSIGIIEWDRPDNPVSG